MAWGLLFLSVGVAVGAQTLLKLGSSANSIRDQLINISTIFGLFLYGFTALAYIIALRSIQLSIALPCTAVSYVGVALIGHYYFGDTLTVLRVVGISIICFGVVILALG
jgi:multidrug transporter EmrE-like cation transporter